MDVMQELVSDAKKNKFSNLADTLTDDAVIQVWESVSGFIEKQMSNQKGVNIPGLGTFTFGEKKLEITNDKFVVIQRPVFQLSEKFSQVHGLTVPKRHVEGQIPVVQLNLSAIAHESPFSRDVVDACIKEVLQALARSVANKRHVEFTFSGIGRLQFHDSKVKMKFFKTFINSIDSSGRLVDALQNRQGTVDSVISERSFTSRPGTNTLILPRITSGGLALTPVESVMPTIHEEAPRIETPRTVTSPAGNHLPPEAGLIRHEDPTEDIGPPDDAYDEFDTGIRRIDDQYLVDEIFDDDGRLPNEPRPNPTLLRQLHASRLPIPMAKLNGVTFGDDSLIVSPKGLRPPLTPMHFPPNSRLSNTPQDLTADVRASHSTGHLDTRKAPPAGPPSLQVPATPAQTPDSSCGHKNAGQELCYVCHQRDRRNVPVSLTEERVRREQEEDQVLHQFQRMTNTEAAIQEQEGQILKRHDTEKMAAFNLGVAEAINSKKMARPLDFHASYVFQKRPLTPSRFLKQEQYHTDLAEQVRVKEDLLKRRKADKQFLERLEQVQLAEDLAAQREQYRKDKNDQQEQYKRALSAQLRFKPFAMPARVSDSDEAFFGKHDMSNETLVERRRRAHDLYKEQVQTVEQRKRDAILRRLTEQKDEESMLQRTKHELLDDRANRFERMFQNRKHLEQDWAKSRDTKKDKEMGDKQQQRMAGELFLDQCDKYRRCGQCKRHLKNYGETNIWRETRYIPGSRLMV